MIIDNFLSSGEQRTNVPKRSLWCSGALALCGFGAISCGDTLVPGSSLDKVEFSLHGVITLPSAEVPAGPLELGILWVDPAQAGNGNYVSGSELVSTTIEADGTYTLGLLGAPPAGAIRVLKSSAEGGTTVALAWGEIILYEDRNGDGTFAVGPLAEGSPMAVPDVYRGMPVDGVLLYFAETVAERDKVIPEIVFPAKKGYHVGLVRCIQTDQSPAAPTAIYEAVPPSATINVTAPSFAFPDLRPCLRSQPPPPHG
jgi:hypothetical protein